MKYQNQRIYPLIIWLVLLSSQLLVAQKKEPLKVLFVGNSFTYFYNLPQVVSAMAESNGQKIVTRQSTVGGSNLEQHWKEEKGTQTRKMLENDSWDYVVFNNHSLSAINSPDSFHEYGTKFADLIKKKGGKPIFMITWAYKSNPLMQKKITAAYYELAQNTASDFVPAGPLFAEVRKSQPELELFHDDKHPSETGTYLIGLAFYKYFINQSTSEIPKRLATRDINGEKLYLIFMSQETADYLQQTVDEFSFVIEKDE